MRKIYSIMFAAVALFTAASCQKELVNAPEVNGVPCSFTATVGTETKTVLAEGNKVNWSVGDNIIVFNAEGKAVTFYGQNETVSATADFTADAFNKGDNTTYAAYPVRSTTNLVDNTIKDLRVAGTQTAVAGSFDPESAVLVGTEVEDGVLHFKNVNSLIKFTIGGDKAPSKVTFTNGGWRHIVGRFDYETATGTITPWNDGQTATLVPAEGESFEVGVTYYIAIVPGGNLAKMSLKFDDTEVKYIEEAKYADETNNFLVGKIMDFGTVAFPAENPGTDEPVEQLEATLVRALQSQGAESYMTTFGGTANTDRNMTMDGEYIYIAETQKSPVLWKISIADGTAKKMPVGTVDGGGTFALACPRIIKNTDPNINGGKDVLAVCNMGQGKAVYLYLYTNGTDADPIKISMHYDGLDRRLGDQFSVSGTLQSGYVWFKEQGSNAVMLNQLAITSENLVNYAAEGIWPDRVMIVSADTARGSVYFYPSADWSEAIYTSTAASAYVTRIEPPTDKEKATYETTEFVNSYTGCHGFNFFKHNDKDYIAYTSFSKQTLYIIEGAADAAGVKAALDAQRVVFEAKIAAEGNSCYSGNSGADCMVYVKDGKTYVAGHVQNVGVVVYELSAE